MANPFETYTFDKANSVFVSLKKTLDKTASNRKYILGDDWQNGGGWVGPHFDGNGKISEILREQIKRDFASKSDIKAVVRRHRRGVIGRVPNWMVSTRNAPADPEATPNDADDALIGEAQKILNEFWKNSRVHQTLKDFVTDYLTSEHAVLRLYFVQTDDAVHKLPSTIEDAVKRIHLFREEPAAGCIVVDKKTLKRASFFRYEEDGAVYIEMCFVDDDGNTVFKKLSQTDAKEFADRNLPTVGKYIKGNTDAEVDFITLPLNEKLLVFEMKGEAFITAAMRSQQKLVNKAFTMMSHNLDEDGFRKKKILNGLPPGKFGKDATGAQIYIPDPDGEQVGAGSISYTQGLPTVERDAEGRIKTSYTTPSVHESEPIDVKTFIETAKTASEAILEEADQMHITISGDAAPSGESRIQARDNFRQSLEDTKSAFDDCVSEVFETVLAVVAYLMEQDNRFVDLQVTVSALLNLGPKSIEERRVAREETTEGFRSIESAMEEIGITDPDAMKAIIKQEQEEKSKPPKDPTDDPATGDAE